MITEEVVKAAASNGDNGKEVMVLLLDRRGADVVITEEVVKAAASNEDNGKEVIALLLDRRGAEVMITEEVVKAAAANPYNGREVMALLLDWRGADVVITEEVVKAAADNYSNGKEVMALLLDRKSADVTITEEMVVRIVEHFDQNVVALLLDRRGADVAITEEVVKAAAGHIDGSGVIRCLHDFTELRITEMVIESAATSGQEDTLSLLAQWAGTGSVAHDWVCIAQLCAAAKAGHTKTVFQLVQQSTPPDKKDIRGTTPLWHAASMGHTDIVRILLATNSVDVNVESVSRRTPIFLTAASGYVEIVKLLLAHGARQDYTDKDGWSPLAIARLYRQDIVADVLANHHATKSAANNNRFQ